MHYDASCEMEVYRDRAPSSSTNTFVLFTFLGSLRQFRQHFAGFVAVSFMVDLRFVFASVDTILLGLDGVSTQPKYLAEPRIRHNYTVTEDHSRRDSSCEPFTDIQRVKVQSVEPRILPRPDPRSLPDSKSCPDSRSRPETAPISHPDPAMAFKILKRDFHSFREQAAKERAEAEAYRVRIAELEKKQFLLRATLDHCNVYNDNLDRTARVSGTPDSSTTYLPNQGQVGSMFQGGPNQIIYVTHPLNHPSFPFPAPQPSTIPNDPPAKSA
ncbi:hypothetical protein ACLB2K_052576 [Fragaria x ananassa]